ncbi:hypothetical protein [Burkholderia contaminans]|uniref:hypothetical protein n=1 Tax=Burkholderia contaminans TaxID=488447 RepID=UPI0011B29B2B|nr:hypothetical protein [Burkholderia contaminans]
MELKGRAMDSANLVIEPTTERSQQPYWPGTWVTIVELEFQHIIIDSSAVGDVSRLGPSPDQLHEGLNTSVTVVTSNGFLLWMPDGSVVHGDWSTDQQVFTRRDGKGNLALSDVRAWSALPQPIADA